jgi:hypothetical protein
MSCCVCIETFTKQPHKKQAKCPYCEVKACTSCTQKYLESIHEDPHCMGCRRAWTREVMDEILLTTWVNGDYKKHREVILTDRERSRLPAAQIIVERRKEAIERYKIRDEIMAKITELDIALAKLRTQYYLENRRIEILYRGQDPDASKNTQEERRVFVMPCPASECRGFLSQAYKCGVCDIFVCPDCREIKGLQRDGEHTCNQDTVATVQKMKKECRPCPECGSSIFKIEGCDQMFCTACNTPFSWLSGKKITSGAIHNPHYFQYIRQVQGGQARTPGDIPCLAHLPTAWNFDREVTRRFPSPGNTTPKLLYEGLLVLTHIHAVEIPQVTTRAEDQDNTEVNVRYLLKQIDDVRWKQLLQQKEKTRVKKDEIRMRYEAFVGACVDIFGNLMNVARAVITITPAETLKITTLMKETSEQFVKMIDIFNQGMLEISKRYKCQVITINSQTMKRTKVRHSTGRKKTPKLRRNKTTETPVDDGSDTDEPEGTENEIVQII